MRKPLIILALVAAMAFLAAPIWAANAPEGKVTAQAAITLTDPVGYVDSSNSVIACSGPADAPFEAVNSYTITLTAPKQLTIRVDDCCCIGDYYRVTINGQDFFSTPNPAEYCAEGTDSWGCVSGTCTPLSSGSASICLPAGTYIVRIFDDGFINHTAAEIAAETMCPAGFTVTINTSSAADCNCSAVQKGIIFLMPDESTFKNHGKYVSSAAHWVNFFDALADLSEECESCIMNQFARSVPQDEMVDCDNK